MNAIRYEECTSCGKRIAQKAAICPGCWGREFVEREASGLGTIYTATRVFTSLPDARWESIVPYDVVLVDLEEGFQLLGRAALSVSIAAASGVRVRGSLIDGVPHFEET